jgi:hypothetical protein
MFKSNKLIEIALNFIIISLVIGIIVVIYFNYTDNLELIRSDLDKKKYYIRKTNDKDIQKMVVNRLAAISERIDKLVDYMKNNKLPNEEVSNMLFYRWKKCKLKETSKADTSVAYTVNKGTELRICVRKSKNELEDLNTTMFVILHELAHIASKSYGHNSEFKRNFSYIAKIASSIGIYKPQNFETFPVNFCNSIKISSTPCDNNTCQYKNIETEPPYNTHFSKIE